MLFKLSDNVGRWVNVKANYVSYCWFVKQDDKSNATAQTVQLIKLSGFIVYGNGIWKITV